MGKRMHCLEFRLSEQQIRAIKRLAQIVKEAATFMTNRKKNKTRLEAYGVAVMALDIYNACNADRSAEFVVLRKSLTIEDAERYASTLAGAGYEW